MKGVQHLLATLLGAAAGVLAGAGAAHGGYGAPPALEDLGMDWVPAEPARDTPTITNFWGGASVRHDLLSVGAMVHAPFAAQLLNSTLRVNGAEPTLREHRWTACEAARRGEAGGVRVETLTRLGFEQRLLIQRIQLTPDAAAGAGADIDVELALGGPLVRRCGGATGLRCGWGAPLPWNATEFEFLVDAETKTAFVADTAAAGGWGGAVVLDADSGERATVVVSGDGRLHARLRLAPGGWTGGAEVQLLVAFGESRGEVAAALARAASSVYSVATLFLEACSLWQDRWDAAFRPGNAHFSGNLPTLEVDDDPDGELERMYWASALAVVAMERTNLNLFDRVYVISEGQPIFYEGVNGGVFTNGGAGQFVWDLSVAAVTLALLDPAANRALVRHVARYADLSAEPLRLPQQWDAFQEPRGVGDTQYAFDYIATWDLVEAHVRYTEEYDLLEERVASGGEATLRDLLNRTAWSYTEFPSVPISPFLADYGGDVNFFLEVVPPYLHGLPALQFSSARMLRSLAELEARVPAPGGGPARYAAQKPLNASATSEAIAAAATDAMWDGSGAWRCLYPDGTAAQVRTAADAVWIARAMGVLSPLPRPGKGLGANVLSKMAAFVEAELWEPKAKWFRALSKADPFVEKATGVDAKRVLRADWGTAGSYASLPAMLAELYVAADGDFERFVATLRHMGAMTRRGTLGQGTAVEAPPAMLNYTGGRAPEPPFAPNFPEFFADGSSWPSTERAITVAAGATVDAVVRTLFGYQPGLGAGACRAARAEKFLRPDTPRPVTATLRGLRTPCGPKTLRISRRGVEEL